MRVLSKDGAWSLTRWWSWDNICETAGRKKQSLPLTSYLQWDEMRLSMTGERATVTHFLLYNKIKWDCLAKEMTPSLTSYCWWHAIWWYHLVKIAMSHTSCLPWNETSCQITRVVSLTICCSWWDSLAGANSTVTHKLLVMWWDLLGGKRALSPTSCSS